MSLILEALRKSEAERRRGAAPDVAMELPPTPAARARAMPPWLLPALAAGALAILAAAWWSQREPAMPMAAAPPPSDAVAPAAPAAPVVVARAQPQPAVAAPVVVAPATPSPQPVVATAPQPRAEPIPERPSPPPAAPAPAASVAAQDIPDIADTGLPPVKLSMHMWDPSPARRFVILDGQRMGEGDRNGELAVVAIERDGVIVERDGRRARVSLP